MPSSQISTGSLFEMLRPVVFVLAVLLSAWVLADARRCGFRAYAVGAWTLLTLLSPPVVFPLYLLARMLSRRRESALTSSISDASDTTASDDIATPHTTGHTATETTGRHDEAVGANTSGAAKSSLTSGAAASALSTDATEMPLKWRRALPLLYAAVMLSLAAMFFLRDYRSVDAHLARAEDAKLFLQSDRAIREYRAALKLEDDLHTRKLLAVELAGAGRAEEALAEFLTAERGGEPDERLPYHIATALDALNRPAEAAPYYQKFLYGRLCAQTPPDARCETARARSGN